MLLNDLNGQDAHASSSTHVLYSADTNPATTVCGPKTFVLAPKTNEKHILIQELLYTNNDLNLRLDEFVHTESADPP